jgi:hypothetical protein
MINDVTTSVTSGCLSYYECASLINFFAWVCSKVYHTRINMHFCMDIHVKKTPSKHLPNTWGYACFIWRISFELWPFVSQIDQLCFISLKSGAKLHSVSKLVNSEFGHFYLSIRKNTMTSSNYGSSKASHLWQGFKRDQYSIHNLAFYEAKHHINNICGLNDLEAFWNKDG